MALVFPLLKRRVNKEDVGDPVIPFDTFCEARRSHHLLVFFFLCTMKRLRSQTRKERSALEMLLSYDMDDIVNIVVGAVDMETLRHLASVSKKVHGRVCDRLSRVRYFYSSWTIFDNGTLGNAGRSIMTSDNNGTPNFEKAVDSLAKDYSVPRKKIFVGAYVEIDPTDANSRSFYKEPGPNQPPLPPLEWAQAHAKKKKLNEFVALFKEAVEKGLLPSLQ